MFVTIKFVANIFVEEQFATSDRLVQDAGRNRSLHLVFTVRAYRDHIRVLAVRQVLAPAPGCPGLRRRRG